VADAGEQIIEILNNDQEVGLWRPSIGDATALLGNYLVTSAALPNQHSANLVITEARRILAQCTPPTGPSQPRTGLVCGYVQSGKTASMTAVSAIAKDNGYRIIILLAGVTTNLVAQNRDRLETHLRAAGQEWAWVMLTNPRPGANSPEIHALLEEWRSDSYDDNDRRTLFISVMKNHSHLRNLINLLSLVNLSNVPAIIFDDEADQASLNTRPNAPIASSTYTHINNLRARLPHHTYLQYTATPQAPLLITRIDSLSADFAELVSPGEGYTGGREFFAAANSYVSIIPANEIYRDDNLPIDPPDSLIRAMQSFFVGVAVGQLSPTRTHRSMLIHPSKATNTHRHYCNWANRLKSAWHTVLLARHETDRLGLIDEFRDAYTELTRTSLGIPTFEQLLRRLPVAINQTAVTLVNSVDGREVPWQNAYSHILVGGEKLGRGYTVRGLTVTYMPRSPGGWTADTIQQRARFFGYHSDYLGYCRIFLHQGVHSAYLAYVSHEEDMRGRLAEHRGHPLQEWRRLFYLDQRLAPTRRNVLSSPYIRPRLSGGWFWPRAPHISPKQGGHNREILRQLDRIDFQADSQFNQHHYARVYLRELYEQVLVPLSYYDEDDALGLCVVNCNLKTLLERNDDGQCLVYLMSRGSVRERTLTSGRIPQLFQGRSSAGADSYPGDLAFSDTQIPTIQIHLLRIGDGSRAFENVPAIAVKIPSQQDILVHDEP